MSYLIYPFVTYYLERKFVPLVFVFFPGVNEETVNGYITLTCLHIFLLFISSLGLAGVDIFYAVLLVNIPIMSKLIEVECKDLNRILAKNSKRDYLWKQRFQNILLMHLEETK